MTAAPAILAVAILVAVWAGAAPAEYSQKGNLVVTANGNIKPRKLPRTRLAPVEMWVASKFQTTDATDAPQLRRARIQLNRHGKLYTKGLPRCGVRKIRFATTEQALARCRKALVGSGHVSSKIAFPEQAPLPAEGRLLAFNARRRGKLAILTHTYGTKPLAVTYVLTFVLKRIRRGPYGPTLIADFPVIAGDWGYISSFKLALRRTYRYRGKRRSYLSAACSVPKGISAAVFPLARITYNFADGRRLATGVYRACRVRK